MYSKKVLQHFKMPHNFGKMKNADAIGKVGNIVCGDVMWLYIKVGKNKKKEDVIKDVKFETFGCTAAIATSSVITDLAKGKTLDEALKISKNDIIKELDGLPAIKVHCSILANDALAEAIYEYKKANKQEISAELEKIHQRNAKEREIADKNG